MEFFVAAGAGADMETPYAARQGNQIAFSFEDAGEQRYLVRGPVLKVPQAVALIKRRMEDFEAHEGTRESFEHKVIRKFIAAQGKGFERQLRGALDKAGIMELNMMFSPDSHTQTSGRQQLAEDLEGGAQNLTVDAKGKITGHWPPEMQDNSGHSFEESAGRSESPPAYGINGRGAAMKGMQYAGA